ncbi:MAG: ABC transporter substrate-binding protein, partial [Planctomycetaceae bacterium]|nr:ABC transporter substrate-binding protein [Planctomycetaceae bacterium]
MPPSPPPHPPRLIDELRESRRDLIKLMGPVFMIALIGLLIAFYFVEPPPPKELVIAAGPADGNYYAVAQRYAPLFAENGVKLTVRETAGSVENYSLLLNDDAVDLAIVQGGTSPQHVDTSQLESLATLYLEPMWVFHQRDAIISRLSELPGKRIAIGADGSGTQVLVEMLLTANGVEDARNETRFVRAGLHETVRMLQAGEVDVAFFVLSAESPIVHELLADEALGLMDLDRSRAYAQRYPFLSDIVLARGVVDLQRDLPRQDVRLIAPAANLVATSELHDAFIPLLMKAAIETHVSGGLVTRPGERSMLAGTEFKPNAISRHYLEHGPSFFQKFLGFWLASLVDRAKVMLLPLFVLVIPLAKLAPPVYRWQIRSRIYRWYALLRRIDQSLRNSTDHELHEFRHTLGRIDRELEEISVPLSYMEEFYHLRLHIDHVKQRLDERLRAIGPTL